MSYVCIYTFHDNGSRSLSSSVASPHFIAAVVTELDFREDESVVFHLHPVPISLKCEAVLHPDETRGRDRARVAHVHIKRTTFDAHCKCRGFVLGRT